MTENQEIDYLKGKIYILEKQVKALKEEIAKLKGDSSEDSNNDSGRSEQQGHSGGKPIV